MGLFDDVISGISRELDKVQSKSQELLQIYNLKSEAMSIENKKTAILLELGTLVFEKYTDGKEVSEEYLKAKTDEIVKLEHKLTVIQAEIVALQAQNDPNASYSKKAEAHAGYTATPGFNCPHCGAEANRAKSFCPSCGGNIGDGNSDDSD